MGGNRSGLGAAIQEKIARLRGSRAPDSTLPFLMRVMRAVMDGSLPEQDAAETLDLIDSFLTRRAIVGHEPTGLHAVFKRLWQDCRGTPDAASASASIAAHVTVTWPADDEVMAAVRSRPPYRAGITRYLLLEHNRSLGGDVPTSGARVGEWASSGVGVGERAVAVG